MDEKITQLEAEIAKSGVATPELSNKLLRPLQQVKEDLIDETSIAGIYMLQSQTIGERLDEALYELDLAIQKAQEAERKKQLAAEQATKAASATTQAPVAVGTISEKPAPVYVPPPKPVVEIMPASIFSKVSSSIYVETESDVEQFVAALKNELQQAIANNKRVRIR